MTNYAQLAHFGNYDPSSFGWSRNPDLVPMSFDGTNFGTCARQAHGVFMSVLTDLAPHIPGGINFGPHDDWAYSATDDLPDGSWSFHHYGDAFDLNWRENPMGQYSSNPFAGQKGAIPHAIAHIIATKYGCEYGGDWYGTKDFMHFECHLSPAVAETIKAPNGTSTYALEDDVTPADIQEIAKAVWAYNLTQTDPANGKKEKHAAWQYLTAGWAHGKRVDTNVNDAKDGVLVRVARVQSALKTLGGTK